MPRTAPTEPLPELRRQNLPSALLNLPYACQDSPLLERTEPAGWGPGWLSKAERVPTSAWRVHGPLCIKTHSFSLFAEQETGIVLVPRWDISVFPSALALSSAFPALPAHQVQRFPQEQAGNKEVTEATESSIYSCPLGQEWVVKLCLAGAALGRGEPLLSRAGSPAAFTVMCQICSHVSWACSLSPGAAPARRSH